LSDRGSDTKGVKNYKYKKSEENSSDFLYKYFSQKTQSSLLLDKKWTRANRDEVSS